MLARSIHHIATQKVEVRELELAAPDNNEVVIKTRYSAISPGTESMIYRGLFPPDLSQDESIRNLSGNFEYPFRYGYSLVGTVIDSGRDIDPKWLGRSVFVFHPHQDLVVVPVSDCLLLADGISAKAALFLPNMESAVSFTMDAGPVIGDRICVFGLGVVGLLTTALLARIPLEMLLTADPLGYRREMALTFGASDSIDPTQDQAWAAVIESHFNSSSIQGMDISFELSGNMEALNQAIEICGFSGKIIVASWYGRQTSKLDLGGHFHRRRIQLISSQVSTINPALSGRWNKDRRIALSWEMIRQIKPERLITHQFPLHQCDRAYQVNSEHLENALQVIFEY